MDYDDTAIALEFGDLSETPTKTNGGHTDTNGGKDRGSESTVKISSLRSPHIAKSSMIARDSGRGKSPRRVMRTPANATSSVHRPIPTTGVLETIEVDNTSNTMDASTHGETSFAQTAVTFDLPSTSNRVPRHISQSRNGIEGGHKALLHSAESSRRNIAPRLFSGVAEETRAGEDDDNIRRLASAEAIEAAELAQEEGSSELDCVGEAAAASAKALSSAQETGATAPPYRY